MGLLEIIDLITVTAVAAAGARAATVAVAAAAAAAAAAVAAAGWRRRWFYRPIIAKYLISLTVTVSIAKII